MSKGSTSSDAPFGTLLGYAPGGVAIYSSNYSSLNPQDYPDDATFRSYIGNEYMGHKWQCVEFARRFLFLTYGFVFTDVGMAYEIFSLRFLREVVNDNILPLQAFANGSRRPPIAGSLLIWQKGGEFKHTGHVAVITQLVGNKVRIAEQNVISLAAAAGPAVDPRADPRGQRRPVHHQRYLCRYRNFRLDDPDR
ncbi:Glutathionylspermidine synthase / Glutathionylspermidine amidohydrolase [Klebsiella pneumoniae IS10]|nr:Glutathionylspermidine synthase / Glutathionylspermidine amidohydrolase [Klebsiella pneumoniae IS10]